MLDPPDPDPLLVLRRWHQQATEQGLDEPDAMTLATATPDGRPSLRVVLFKGIEDGAVCWVTNYHSRKARQIEQNKHAALNFFWARLKCQVRLEGVVSRAATSASDAYFRSRPRESQLGAWASEQSQPIASRAELERRFREFEERFRGKEVERPPQWGLYRLLPESVELWIAGDHRLHDRFQYDKTPGGTWSITRLSP